MQQRVPFSTGLLTFQGSCTLMHPPTSPPWLIWGRLYGSCSQLTWRFCCGCPQREKSQGSNWPIARDKTCPKRRSWIWGPGGIPGISLNFAGSLSYLALMPQAWGGGECRVQFQFLFAGPPKVSVSMEPTGQVET